MKNYASTKKFNFLIATCLSLGLLFGFLSVFLFASPTQNAKAATEPTCPSYPATTPTFNPFPLVLNSNSPDFTDQPCRDLPMLYWFPLDTAANNPRRLEVTEKQNVTFYTYYNNGARPGSGAITNPNLKIAVTKDKEVGDRIEYRISGTLSASNATTITSSQKGGDLILSVPKTTKLDIVSQQTNQWPTRLIRSEEEETSGRPGNDLIPDNSVGATSWNPIYTAFPDKTAASTTGHNLATNLEAGFLNYGLVSTQISADPNAAPIANQPPVLTGQEITITRGQNGSFQIYNGTDPDGNVPLRYEINGIPAFCTNDANTRLITCTTGANTPIKSTFTITPVDSKGLKGTPATFIVNIIEPAATNQPPVLTGQEITIIRGQNGSFQVYTGTDPDNNVPLTYTIQGIPTFCTNNTATRVITCTTGANTPVKSTFTITPVDSKGLSGTPATFIVNVIEPQNPALSIVKTANPASGTSVKADDQITFNLKTSNPGQATAPGVILTDKLDEKLVFISCTNNCTNTSGTLTWNLGNIEAGKTVEVSFIAKVKTGTSGSVKNTSTATFQDPKTNQPSTPITSNETVHPISTLNNPPTLTGQEITITRGQNGSFQIYTGADPDGDVPLTYEINGIPTFCTNNTATRVITCTTGANTPIKSTFTITPVDSKGLKGTPATFVVNVIEVPVTNQPPTLPGQEITIVRGKDGSFQVYTGTDPNGDTITYEVISLPTFCTNNTTTRIITCKPNSNTPAKTTFTIVPTDSKGLKGTPATFVVNVVDPDLTVTKLCFKKGTQEPCSSSKMMAGDLITYQIQVKNPSSVVVENVTLTDVIDSNLENIANIQPPVSNYSQNRDIVWTLGSIKPGETITGSFDAKIKAGVSSKVVNTATATSPMIVGDRKSTVEFTPGVEPAILDTSDKVCKEKTTGKNCKDANLTLGSTVVYTINVRNTGKGEAKNVKVVDTCDKARLTKIENISSGGNYDANAGTLTWTLNSLAGGQTSSFSFEATVNTTAKNNDVIVNTARITADNIPSRDVKVDFPVVIAAPVTPRTGGMATVSAVLSLGLFAVAGFYYYRNNQLNNSFVPQRSVEVKSKRK